MHRQDPFNSLDARGDGRHAEALLLRSLQGAAAGEEQEGDFGVGVGLLLPSSELASRPVLRQHQLKYPHVRHAGAWAVGWAVQVFFNKYGWQEALNK